METKGIVGPPPLRWHIHKAQEEPKSVWGVSWARKAAQVNTVPYPDLQLKAGNVIDISVTTTNQSYNHINYFPYSYIISPSYCSESVIIIKSYFD